jgi:hypothetical protein
MRYKTMALKVLRQNPELYQRLHSTRRFLPTLRLFAMKLKLSHKVWKKVLSRSAPGPDKGQIAGEALEQALLDLKDFMGKNFPPEEESEPLTAEGPKAFIIARMRGA